MDGMAEGSGGRRRGGSGKGTGSTRDYKHADSAGTTSTPTPPHLIAAPHSHSVKPETSRGGRYIFVANGSVVSVYARRTGERLSALVLHDNDDQADGGGGGAEVCQMTRHPGNPLQLLVGYRDGRLVFWDVMDAVVLRTVRLSDELTRFVVTTQDVDGSPHLLVVAVFGPAAREGRRKREESESHLVQYYILPSTRLGSSKDPNPSGVLVGKVRGFTELSYSPNQTLLVVTGDTEIHLAKARALYAGWLARFVLDEQREKVNRRGVARCASWAPSGAYYAVGDHIGRIHLFYGLQETVLDDAAKTERIHPIASHLHWHAHGVLSLDHAPAIGGGFMLSGGEEGVLVIWRTQEAQLSAADRIRGAGREYIARLGGRIASISVCSPEDTPGEESNDDDDDDDVVLGVEWIVTLHDGTLVLINSVDLKVRRVISKLKTTPRDRFRNKGETLFAIHPRSHYYLLPSSHPSLLQLVDAAAETLVTELEVAPTNRISRTNEDDKVPESHVSRFALGLDGHWLATIDERAYEGKSRAGTGPDEVFLKIWQWNEEGHHYELNTRIDQPHRGRITTMAFSGPKIHGDQDVLLVTGSDDGQVHLYRLREERDRQNRITFSWKRRSSVGYRQAACTASAISPDGALLVAVFGGHVTLWKTSDGESLFALPLGATRAEHRKLGSLYRIVFVGPTGRWILLQSTRSLMLWDLLSRRSVWQASTCSGTAEQRVLLAASSVIESFAIATVVETRTVVDEYQISQSDLDPVALRKTYHWPHKLVALTSSTDASEPFFGLTETTGILHLGKGHERGPESQFLTSISQSHSQRARTLFDGVLDVHPVEIVANEAAEDTTAPSRPSSDGRLSLDCLDAKPLHLMTPFTETFTQLFSAMSGSVYAQRERDEDPERDKDIEMAPAMAEANVASDHVGLDAGRDLDEISQALQNAELDGAFNFAVDLRRMAIDPAPASAPIKVNGGTLPSSDKTTSAASSSAKLTPAKSQKSSLAQLFGQSRTQSPKSGSKLNGTGQSRSASPATGPSRVSPLSAASQASPALGSGADRFVRLSELKALNKVGQDTTSDVNGVSSPSQPSQKRKTRS